MSSSQSADFVAKNEFWKSSRRMTHASRLANMTVVVLAIAICCTSATAASGLQGNFAGMKSSIVEGCSLRYDPEFSVVGTTMHLRGGGAAAKAAKPKKSSKASTDDQYEVTF